MRGRGIDGEFFCLCFKAFVEGDVNDKSRLGSWWEREYGLFDYTKLEKQNRHIVEGSCNLYPIYDIDGSKN